MGALQAWGRRPPRYEVVNERLQLSEDGFQAAFRRESGDETASDWVRSVNRGVSEQPDWVRSANCACSAYAARFSSAMRANSRSLCWRIATRLPSVSLRSRSC